MKSLSRYNSVDVMKFIMAFAVITIHARVLFKGFEYSPTVEWLIRLAVPFFFMSSGFFVGRHLKHIGSDKERRHYMLEKAKKFGRMFVWWLIIYLPLQLIAFQYDTPKAIVLDLYNYSLDIILKGESNYAWPLWYIYSSMWVYFLISFIINSKHRILWLLSLMLVAIAVKLSLPYLPIQGMGWMILEGVGTRILGGAPYIVTGMLLYGRSERYGNYLVISALIVISILLFSCDINISPLFGGAAVFLLCMKISLPDKSIFSTLNALSVWIFFIHMYVIVGLMSLKDTLDFLRDPYVSLFASFIISFVFSDILYVLSTKTSKFKKLQILIK